MLPDHMAFKNSLILILDTIKDQLSSEVLSGIE